MAAESMLKELNDKKKASWKWLSSAGGEKSHAVTTPEQKLLGLGKMAVNDPSKSTFGGLTRQTQHFGCMSFSNAGGVTQIKRNKDFYRGIGDDSVGAFHQLTTEMKEALLWVAMADAKLLMDADNKALEQQRNAKQRREELMADQEEAKKTEANVDILCYHRMFMNSDACWKTVEQVDEEMSCMTLKTLKLK